MTASVSKQVDGILKIASTFVLSSPHTYFTHVHEHTHPQVTTLQCPNFREEDSNRAFTALEAAGLDRMQLINEVDEGHMQEFPSSEHQRSYTPRVKKVS